MWKRETRVLLRPASPERPAPPPDMGEGWQWICGSVGDYHGEWFVTSDGRWRADGLRFLDEHGNVVPRTQHSGANLVANCPQYLDIITVEGAVIVTEMMDYPSVLEL